MNQRIGEIGFALQSALGAPASSPTYALGVEEGLPSPMQEALPWLPAAHRLVAQEVRKGSSRWETGTTIWSYPASMGVLLKAVLPTENVTGSNPYDHEFTPGATDKYMTLFSTRPGPLYEKYADGLIETLILDWMSGRRLYTTVQASGITPTILGSAYTAGTREDESGTAEALHYVGATMKLDWADTPAVTTLTNIEDGAMRFTRRLSFVPTADGMTVMSMIRGPLEAEVQLSLIWQDYDGYRTTFMGAATGSTPSPTLVYGSLDFTFVSAVNPSTRKLRIQLPRVAFRWEAPQPAPRSGALMVDVQGLAVRPASGAFVTATLKNGISGSY